MSADHSYAPLHSRSDAHRGELLSASSFDSMYSVADEEFFCESLFSRCCGGHYRACCLKRSTPISPLDKLNLTAWVTPLYIYYIYNPL